MPDTVVDLRSKVQLGHLATDARVRRYSESVPGAINSLRLSANVSLLLARFNSLASFTPLYKYKVPIILNKLAKFSIVRFNNFLFILYKFNSLINYLTL